MKTLLLMPTYNERENIEAILGRVLTAVPTLDVLVIDDGSPDGTGDIADQIAANDARVRVWHRAGKLGLGTAYIGGFKRAIDEGYEAVIEFDADGSHLPEQLPDLIAASEAGADLVIGSRWVRGGKVVNWPWYRYLISLGGSMFSRVMLGSKLRDITAGYRVYKTDALKRISLDEVASSGYGFQVEMTWIFERKKFAIREVPITFVERTLGASKMSGDIVVEAMVRVFGWGLGYRARSVKKFLDEV